MGELARTAIIAGIGMAVVGVGIGAMIDGSGAPEGSVGAAPIVEAVPSFGLKTGIAVAGAATLPAAVIAGEDTAMGRGFAALRVMQAGTLGVSYGQIVEAERHCMAEALGRAVEPAAWRAHERIRLFMAAMRHGGAVPQAPEGTEQFRAIVRAAGHDPARALEQGSISLADVQFASGFMTSHLFDTATALHDGITLAPNERADLDAMVKLGQTRTRELDVCLGDVVQRNHGVDIYAAPVNAVDRQAALAAD